MKAWLKVLLGAVVGFGGGFAAGYFTRKKFFEVEIEEVSEEELNKMAIEAQNTPSDETEGGSNTFMKGAAFVDSEAKEAVFRQWKENPDIQEMYDTRSDEVPENVETISEEELDGAIRDIPDVGELVEPGSMTDWSYWSNYAQDEGVYDPIELIWYEGDDVVCDENGEPMENSDKFLGFDIAEQFDKIAPDLSGDDNVRIVINHQHHSIFYINRRKGSYSQHRRLEELGSDGYDDEEDDEENDVQRWIHDRR